MNPLGPIRPLVLATALLLTIPLPAGEAKAAPTSSASSPTSRPASSTLTLKERSSGKAGDEQRVNDCKVPFDQRGDHHRPADCAAR